MRRNDRKSDITLPTMSITTGQIGILFILLLVSGANAASMITNWPLILQIKSGDHKLLRTSTTGVSTLDYIQAYQTNPNPTTFTAAPVVALCIRDLNIDQTTETIDYTVFIDPSTITASQFISTASINSNVTIGLLYYMYIAFDNYEHTYVFTTSYSNNITNTNSTSISNQYNQTLTTGITQFGQALAYPFVRSFKILAGTEYSFRSEAAVVDN